MIYDVRNYETCDLSTFHFVLQKFEEKHFCRRLGRIEEGEEKEEEEEELMVVITPLRGGGIQVNKRLKSIPSVLHQY